MPAREAPRRTPARAGQFGRAVRRFGEAAETVAGVPCYLFLKADHMRYCVSLLALSYALCGPVRSVAQDGPALKAPPPEASQFDFLVGEWTVDVTSKAPGASSSVGRGPTAGPRSSRSGITISGRTISAGPQTGQVTAALRGCETIGGSKPRAGSVRPRAGEARRRQDRM